MNNAYANETMDYMMLDSITNDVVEVERMIAGVELEHELHEDVRNADKFAGHPMAYNPRREV